MIRRGRWMQEGPNGFPWRQNGKRTLSWDRITITINYLYLYANRRLRHGGGGDSGSALPQAIRLDVTKFNGTDPDSWIFSITEYFALLNTLVDQRLKDGFVESVRHRFGPSKYEDPQGTLSKLLQTGTVAQYQGEFEKLMNRVTDISETLLISFYISGLKPNLQRELLVAKPATLGEVFALARVTKARLMDQQSGTVITTTATSITSQPKPATPRFSGPKTDVGKLPLLPTPTSVSSNIANKQLAIKWISPAKRQECLNKGLWFSVVLVVVDRFSKYAHFATLPTSFNAPKVAEVFVEAVVKHHGIPKTIVSDRDPIFVSKFWTQLFKLSGTQLNHNTAYHPHTDGQTEVVNRGSEQYLRAMVTDHPDHWVRFLPWAEYCYNTSYHSSIKMFPYQALYGKVPLSIIPYPPGSSKVAAVEDVLVEQDELLHRLRDNLLAAKNRMEEKANLKRREVEFNVGDKVLVKLQPYRQLTLARRLSHKFLKRYYGPYEILERIGKVAYRLALPVTSKIHPVFHVSILKPFLGSKSEAVAEIPGESDEGFVVDQPLSVCGSRFVLRDGSLVKQVLVQWAGRSPEDATWEYLSDFRAAYPAYDLEDKVISEEGRNDTPGSLDAGRAKRVSVAPKWQKDFVMG
ncbi:ty3-gypsy retrotransposon protein [Tanacetum coccineum]